MLNKLLGILRARPPGTPAAAISIAAMLDRGEAREAERCARNILAIDAGQADVLVHLALALIFQGRWEEASASARRAISIAPDVPDAHAHLGHSLLFSGRYGEAMRHYWRALELDPRHPDASIYLALLGRQSTHFATAQAFYESHAASNPRSYLAAIRLGAALQAAGRIDAAMEKFALASSLQPGLGAPFASLGALHGAQGCPEQALAHFQIALEKNANPTWESAYLFFMQYSDSLSALDIRDRHVQWGSRLSSASPSNPVFENRPDPERKIKVGYVSGDFCHHPVAGFLEPILRMRDRAQFVIHAYSNTLRPDAATQRLRSLCDGWLDIHALDDETVRRQIRADGIDILIDLSGHTRGHRLAMFAGKAAPVQMTYLGYPSTTGLAAVDYRITDSISDPPGMTEGHYAERLIRLQTCFLCFPPPQDAPAVAPAPLTTKGHVTFGSFNNASKINSGTIRLWAKVLAAVPSSRMVVKHFATSHAAARKRLLDAFAACGIGSERVDLLPAQTDFCGHLDQYREVDIALDTYPYNGTTTTCEALWMGVPVIALAGERHAARVGASLLQNAGLGDWVAPSEPAYVALAIDLAQDPARLCEMRDTLRERLRHSRLMDARRFASEFEAALKSAWRAWCGSVAG